MHVVVWLVEGTWPACVDAARAHAPAGADVTLLYVAPAELAGAAHAAYAGLLGRARPERDPGTEVEHLAADSALALLRDAAARLGRRCATVTRAGRPEHEVVAAAAEADVVILARDGDHTHRGPRSLGPAVRYVVDHAPCAVLLVWPGDEARGTSGDSTEF